MTKIYVMETCPDCTRVIEVAQGDPNFEIIDIGKHIRNLKEFLRIRDNRAEFETARKMGYAGVPSFLLEDGSITFDAEKAGLRLEDYSGAACSIDGHGC